MGVFFCEVATQHRYNTVNFAVFRRFVLYFGTPQPSPRVRQNGLGTRRKSDIFVVPGAVIPIRKCAP